VNSRILAVLSLLLLPVPFANAAPTVSISDAGFHAGNKLLTISVAPDVDSFIADTSLAVELDFTFSHDVIAATLNESFWSIHGDNPGNNPFTGSVAEGLVVDTVNDTIFVAVGSELYATAVPVELMTLELRGLGGQLINMGGNTVLTGTPNEYTSSRIAQNGVNFDGLEISNYHVDCFPCDFDCSGDIGNSDLTLLLDNWGDRVPPVPAGWTGIPPTPPGVDNDELTCLLDAWVMFQIDLDAAANPEPGATALAATAVACLLATRCRGRAAL